MPANDQRLTDQKLYMDHPIPWSAHTDESKHRETSAAKQPHSTQSIPPNGHDTTPALEEKSP